MKKQLYLFLNSIIFCSAIEAESLPSTLPTSVPTPTLTSPASNHFPNASIQLTYQGNDGQMCSRFLTTADNAIQIVAPRTAAYVSNVSEKLYLFGKNMNIGIAIGAVATICIFFIASRLWRAPAVKVKPTININPEGQLSLQQDQHQKRSNKPSKEHKSSNTANSQHNSQPTQQNSISAQDYGVV